MPPGYLMFPVRGANSTWSNRSFRVYEVVSRLNYGGFECPELNSKRVQTWEIRTIVTHHLTVFPICMLMVFLCVFFCETANQSIQASWCLNIPWFYHKILTKYHLLAVKMIQLTSEADKKYWGAIGQVPMVTWLFGCPSFFFWGGLGGTQIPEVSGSELKQRILGHGDKPLHVELWGNAHKKARKLQMVLQTSIWRVFLLPVQGMFSTTGCIFFRRRDVRDVCKSGPNLMELGDGSRKTWY